MQSKKFTTGLLAIILLVSGCASNNEEKTAEKTEKILRHLPETVYEVQVFDLKNDKADIILTKTGQIESEKTVSVSPQISGKITDIHVKVGQTVKKGELLADLGDSLNTDIIDAQNEAAEQLFYLSQQGQNLTEFSSDQQIYAAQISADLAWEAYENSVDGKNNAQDVFEEQKKNSKIEINNAKNALKNSEKTLDDLRDQLNYIQEQITDLKDTPNSENTIRELETAEKELRSAIDGAKLAEKTAENRLDQAKISLNLLEENYKNQLDQLDFGTESAYSQYLIALNQLESAQNGKNLQIIQAENQIIQAESSTKISRFNQRQKEIIAPINGTITAITATEGDFANPGNPIIEIEQFDRLILKVSISAKEAKFIQQNQKVEILSSNQKIQGEISEISPGLNPTNNKFDIEIEITEKTNLLPGMLTKVEIKPKTTNNFFIPLNSVFVQGNQKFARIVNEANKIENIEIQLGEIIGNFVEVTHGLKGSEKIITSVTTFAKEGDKVTIASK